MAVEQQQTDGESTYKRPFTPPITGELRRRLFKYAKEKGRSAASAMRWLLALALKGEGY